MGECIPHQVQEDAQQQGCDKCNEVPEHIPIPCEARVAGEFVLEEIGQVEDERVADDVVKNKGEHDAQWQIEPKHAGPGVAVYFMFIEPDEGFEIGSDAAYYQAGS